MTDKTEWIPEIGQECEISICGRIFEWCIPRYLGESLVVVDHKAHNDQHYHKGSYEFRPLKTKEETEREEAINEAKAIFNVGQHDNITIKEMIDAGYRKHGEAVSSAEELDELYHQDCGRYVGRNLGTWLVENFNITRKVKS